MPFSPWPASPLGCAPVAARRGPAAPGGAATGQSVQGQQSQPLQSLTGKTTGKARALLEASLELPFSQSRAGCRGDHQSPASSLLRLCVCLFPREFLGVHMLSQISFQPAGRLHTPGPPLLWMEMRVSESRAPRPRERTPGGKRPGGCSVWFSLDSVFCPL